MAKLECAGAARRTPKPSPSLTISSPDGRWPGQLHCRVCGILLGGLMAPQRGEDTAQPERRGIVPSTVRLDWRSWLTRREASCVQHCGVKMLKMSIIYSCLRCPTSRVNVNFEFITTFPSDDALAHVNIWNRI